MKGQDISKMSGIAIQADHTVSPGQLVTSNTYEWLRSQENSELKWPESLQDEHEPLMKRRDSLPMETLHRITSAFTGREHGENLGVLQQVESPEDMRYEVQHSVFKPVEKYCREPNVRWKHERERRRQHFEYIVSEAIDALQTYHVELTRIKGGSSGSYFVYGSGPKASPLGVFKPKDEEPYGPLSPKWTKWAHRTFFPCFFGRSCLIPNLGYICESAASLLDQRLELGIVPHTDTVVLESRRFYDQRQTWLYLCGVEPRTQKKLGSFQLFLEDYVSADEFFMKHPLPGMYRDHRAQQNLHLGDRNNTDSGEEQFEWTEINLLKFRLELEKVIVLDYIMRNTDRGLDNWMIKVIPHHRKASTTWDIRLAAIDNGLAFPWKHPDEWRSYPYGWLYLPLHMLAQPFSESTRRHFLPLLTSNEWWKDSYREFIALFSRDSDFKLRMWKKQWAVLKGQAFNVVETLRDHRQGPLELVRRTRCLVADEKMEVPVAIPIMDIAINEQIPVQASSPMNLYNFQKGLQEHASDTGSASTVNPTGEPSGNQFTTKTVIIERLQVVNNTPVLTWC
ncbi:LSB6 (YJL100W) [Zygosaccharomyces parabailii]|nr:LSB6 (YJL100W) [Zygosaccharomyces parabailii]